MPADIFGHKIIDSRNPVFPDPSSLMAPSLSDIFDYMADGNVPVPSVDSSGNFSLSLPSPVLDLDDPSDIADKNNLLAQSAADVANQTQLEWLNRVMKFNAEQADLDRKFQQSSADKAMEYNKSMAEWQLANQERLQSSAYLRTMEDLRKAGLNPNLVIRNGVTSYPSVSGFSGASSGGSSASVSTPSSHVAQTDMTSRASILNAWNQVTSNMEVSEKNRLATFITDLIKGIGSIVPF